MFIKYKWKNQNQKNQNYIFQCNFLGGDVLQTLKKNNKIKIKIIYQ